MPAPASVTELVKRFGDQIEAYKNGKYNETQVRVEFIDPFFKALGWDIHNEQGLAPAYKDVVHEDAIKIGFDTKAPDYCFRIGGTRKFFLEAKKPAVNIKEDVGPAFQVRRYAWSSKLPLSILTDFEEFAVYDCRIKPLKGDKPSVGRVFYCRFEEYEAKWNEIAGIFSKDAVLKGSFDKFAESNKKKKGTAEVDDAFLEEIESWRDILAKNIALRNPTLTVRELNFSVQQIIDRIIFLRICEDRGIEPYGRLHGLLNGTNTYQRLTELFRNADDRYNSGLFHFKQEKDREAEPDRLTLLLKIDDTALKDILKNLYYPDSPYEFSVLPADILGQVYEQFLGKIIRLTEGHQAKIEEKPEVRKAGGVYYTPKYIVDYIVRNTVGQLVESKTPKDVSKLRILDPACGSGSFLIQAYQYLLDWHVEWYSKSELQKHAKGKSPTIYQGPHGEWRLTTQERKRVLLNNIYGVDIDSQAVEVTKLSLLLKVLEGESNQSLNQTFTMFHERALPDLGHNIKCGNSLIEPDFFTGKQIGLLNDNEKYRVNVFDWSTEFDSVFKQGGFNAVIGNPPYGAYLYDYDKEYLNAHYTFQNYQLDSYLLFLEKGLRSLLTKGGRLGMIFPNPWLTNVKQQTTRRYIIKNVRIAEIVHFKYPVFPKVVVDTEIVIFENSNPTDWKPHVSTYESQLSFLSGDKSADIIHSQDQWIISDGDVINIFARPRDVALAKKCEDGSMPMESLCLINVGIKPYQKGKGKPPQSAQVVRERPFDSSKRIDASYRAYLRGSDIWRYRIAPLEPRYLKYGPWLAEPRPAANFDAKLKIVMRQTGDSLVAAIDDKQYLCLNNMHVLVPVDDEISPYFLLGVINSQLMNWYYQYLNPEVGEALAEVKKTNVARLPIKKIDFKKSMDSEMHNSISALAHEATKLDREGRHATIDAEKKNLSRQLSAVITKIDKKVCDLYGLTSEEVALVEQAFSH